MKLYKHYFCVRMLLSMEFLVHLEPKQEGACLYVENTVYGRVIQVNNVLIISPKICSILKSIWIKGDWIMGIPLRRSYLYEIKLCLLIIWECQELVY